MKKISKRICFLLWDTNWPRLLWKIENSKPKLIEYQFFIPIQRKRVRLSSLRSHYKNRPLSQEIAPIEEVHKEKLNSELQEALKVQLARLEGDLASKIQLEDTVKKNLETELSESLRSQFSSVFRSLSATTLSPQHVEIQKLSDSEVKQALDQQLRAFFKSWQIVAISI